MLVLAKELLSTVWLKELEAIGSRYRTYGLSDGLIGTFQELVWQYSSECRREFPWRETWDPYQILVSEIMLQQTQARRVVPKYISFLEQFPDCQALADAPVSLVLEYWQGLGYNRRALSLQRTAQLIIGERGGVFPIEEEELQTLPGIGPYTAAAISAFAFEMPATVLETNIRRLYIQAFFTSDDLIHDRELRALIAATVDAGQPREWYYALMDFGHDLVEMVPNPNVRSKHYSKQSAFKGSHRQLRGKLLQLLLAGRQSIDTLIKQAGREATEVRSTLLELQTEGFIFLDQDDAGLLN